MILVQDCIDIGVKGFKIDSAKYMDPIDIEVYIFMIQSVPINLRIEL